MAWPQMPHKKPKPRTPPAAIIETVHQYHPRNQLERDYATAARRATEDFITGGLVIAAEMALDQERPERATSSLAELGRIKGMYIERHQSQSEVLYRIPALEAMSLEELRALAQLPDAPQPHHEAAPVLPDTTAAT